MEERTTVREERPVVVERPAPVVVEQPGPVVVEQQPEIIVRRPRPVEVVERVGPLRPGEVWIKGGITGRAGIIGYGCPVMPSGRRMRCVRAVWVGTTV